MGSQGGSLGTRALGDPLALGDLLALGDPGPWGPWALGPGALGPQHFDFAAQGLRAR